MKIDSIELINDGYGGVKVAGIESIRKEGATVLVPVVKKYPLPIPNDLSVAIRKLKRYLLEMNNYWIKEYNEHISNGDVLDRSGEEATAEYLRAREIWDSTTLVKIMRRHNGFVLSGRMEAVTSRFFSLTTPLIEPDDGYENFSKLQTGIDYCFNYVASFIEDRQLRLMSPVQYAATLFGPNSDEAERVRALPKKEQDQFMIEALEHKGYIVIGQGDIEVTEAPKQVKGKKE